MALGRTAESKAGESKSQSALGKEESLEEIKSWSPVSGSPTEKRNPRSKNFSELSIKDGIALMLEEDANIPDEIAKESPAIEWVIEKVVEAFEQGGRLFYAGAGTSGRLGVLDASECPPTFRAPEDQVQGIIAGGRRALWSAVEGAEDDAEAGRQAVIVRNVTEKDVLIGITASGHAPFVWGCLEEAGNRGATKNSAMLQPFVSGASFAGSSDCP